MREFWILFKTSLVNNFSLNRLKKKFGDKSGFLRLGVPIITILLAVGVMALLVMYIYNISIIFILANRLEGILYMGAAMGGLFCLISTISKANAYLFESKDYDLLMSLPIKTKVIVASKIGSLLFLNYLSFGAVFLPSAGIYAYFANPGILFYVFTFVLFLIGPLLVVIICSALSYLLGWVLSKFKYKNMIQTIGLLLLFFGFMYFSTLANDTLALQPGEDDNVILVMIESMITTFRNLYYPSVWMVDILVDYNMISLLIYLVVSIVPFLLFVWVVGKNFAVANARARQSYRVLNFQLKEQKISAPLRALFGNEIRRYFSNSGLVLNTIVGPILGTILTGVILFSPQFATADVGLDVSNVSVSFIVAVCLAIAVMMNGLMSTTASSISLEGKQFWILKSLPVSEKKIFLSKVLLNLLIALPFLVINAILVGIVLQPSIFEVFVVVFIPLLVNLLLGVIGLYINLVFPRFDWTAPIKVVKQSLAVFLVVLIGMLMIAGLVVLFIKTLPLGFNLSYLIIIGVLMFLIGGVVALLLTDGIRRFQRLNG